MAIWNIPKSIPLIYLSNSVLLPGASLKIPLTTTRNVKLATDYFIDRKIKSGNIIVGVVPYISQEEASENKNEGKIIGTAGIVVQLYSTNWPQHTFSLTVIGITRIQVDSFLSNDPYPIANVTVLRDPTSEEKLVDEELVSLMEEFEKSAKALFNVLQEVTPVIGRLQRVFETLPNNMILDFCASISANCFEEKWDILKTLDIKERVKKIIPLVLRLKKGLDDSRLDNSPVKNKKSRFIGFLPSNLERRMLFRPDQGSSSQSDAAELEAKIKNANLPEEAAKVASHELSRFSRMVPTHSEYEVQRSYLELVANLPWSKRSDETVDIIKAKQDLDCDHYGMDDVKKRVIEFLAVRQLKNSLRGPILCFVGAPGVGKTSIGRSIASTLGRNFYRMSLGGVSNQSEIRGHRRTYVGAMPGRIIQAIKSVGVKNPVILLDEIDKLGTGVRGDPASALLEVLDPEQNKYFVDHYLNMPFDLSEVMFIATANKTEGIPLPLLDRMETIEVSGYTIEEKRNIGERHLFPKLLLEHGITNADVELPPDSLYQIITGYTKEAGVRSLERKLAAICRDVAVSVATREPTDTTPKTVLIDASQLERILGPVHYDWGFDESGGCRIAGVAMGLSWTLSGGDVLVVEATRVQGGSGELVMTGQLGSVMKESAQLAMNWVRSVACTYGLAREGEDLIGETDVHIHFPAGAIGKEGPSAGITIAVALVSLFSGIPVSSNLAMTGELTLRGVVLPVGGIKEKVISAHRAGIRRVIVPAKCKKYLVHVPATVLDEMKIILVTNMDEVIETAFDGDLAPSKKHQDPLFSRL